MKKNLNRREGGLPSGGKEFSGNGKKARNNQRLQKGHFRSRGTVPGSREKMNPPGNARGI